MSSFKLHSADSDFNTRVDALFNTLQTVAVDLEPQTQGKRPFQDDDTNEFEDGEIHSGTIGKKFRKPDGLPPKWRGRGPHAKHTTLAPRNNTPDYVKNPQNWTRYSMKDTKVSSDLENKKIGIELFGELRSRKKDILSEEDAQEEDVCPKIVFKKPVKPLEEVQEISQSEKTETSVDDYFGGTKKFRMPEYQVGQSKPKGELKVTEKAENERGRTKDAVRLDYLTFDDDDDDEDN